MTQDDFDDIAADQADARGRWLDRCIESIRLRMADAEAHATLAAASGKGPRAPAYLAAVERLESLGDELAGVLLRDARADFFRSAFDHWAPHLDPETHETDAAPTADGEQIARDAEIGGVDLDAEIDDAVERGRRGLLAAVAAAQASPRRSADILHPWRVRTEDALISVCETILTDSQTALFWGVWGALEL